jgi:hypothetical protein
MSSPSPSRRIGRILSLGLPLPGTRVDNYNFLSAPSFFDYDAMVVDVGAMTHLIEEVAAGALEPETSARSRVRLAPEAQDEVALSDLLARRAEETERLLAQGGIVVAFADAPSMLRDIPGTSGLPSYWWLPQQPLPYDRLLVAADGTQAHIVDYQHPMAPFVLSQLANLQYRVRIDLAAASPLPEPLRIFVRSYGGAAIGAELISAGGRIVLLPSLRSIPAGDARYALSDTLQSCIRRMLGVMAEGRAPSWVAQHPLPGLDERATAFEAARRDFAASKAALESAEAARDELARYQALLWQEGALGLEAVVVDALRLIGFDVYDRQPDEIEIKLGDASAFVEIDASDGSVGMAPHYRLRQRIERAIERRGVAPRGLMFVNGYRLTPPEQRAQEASDALRVASETMRYCIATTATLFEGVRAALAGDETAVTRLRDALLHTDGVLDFSEPR